jgi:hypothetical protein
MGTGAMSTPPRVRSLNVQVDDVVLKQVVEGFREGLMLALQVERIVKLHRIPHLRAFPPLGDTADYEAGALVCAPACVADAGFEWLHRVAREPRQRRHRSFARQLRALYHVTRQKLDLYKDPFDGSLGSGLGRDSS